MKSIEFAEQYVGPIQDGAKTATVRVDECEEIEQGDRVRLVSETGQRFETARITSTVETFVGGALHAIRVLDEEYPAADSQALLDGLRHHYGPEIDGRTQCRVLCWELVEAGQIAMADGGTHCRNCALDLEDPKNAGFPFEGDWYCSGFCAEIATGFWTLGHSVLEFNSQLRDAPAPEGSA